MTVKELLEELDQVEDKEKEIIYFNDDGNMEVAEKITEFGNAVAIV